MSNGYHSLFNITTTNMLSRDTTKQFTVSKHLLGTSSEKLKNIVLLRDCL